MTIPNSAVEMKVDSFVVVGYLKCENAVERAVHSDDQQLLAASELLEAFAMTLSAFVEDYASNLVGNYPVQVGVLHRDFLAYD